MKTLTLIFPVYNEENRIEKVFRTVSSYKFPKGIVAECLIFVDDGSIDGTRIVIERWRDGQRKYKMVELISYSDNRGRGYALRTALNKVSTDYALYLDGDMAVPLFNLESFVAAIDEGADLVAGSKKKPGARCVENFDVIRTFIGLGHSVLAFIVLGVFYWDYQGGFKLFSRRFIDEVIPLTMIDRWGFDMEVIFLGEKLGFKCGEVPIFWSGYGKDSKVKLIRDIYSAVRDMIYIRWRWETDLSKKISASPGIAL